MKRSIFVLMLLALSVIGSKILPIKTLNLLAAHPEAVKKSDPSTEKVMASVEMSGELSAIVRVIDGDTIVAVVDGAQEKIRLIGVDTPEVADPRKPVQCFGKEASAFTKNILSGGYVKLESDPSQGDRDKYHRLLRYVFLPDGTFVNKTIIAEGYGHEYTYRAPYRYREDFKIAEHIARKGQKGLWAPDACNTK